MFSKFTTVIRAAPLPSFSFFLIIYTYWFICLPQLPPTNSRSTDIGRFFLSTRYPFFPRRVIPGLRRKIVKAAIIFNVKIVVIIAVDDDDRCTKTRRVHISLREIKQRYGSRYNNKKQE